MFLPINYKQKVFSEGVVSEYFTLKRETMRLSKIHAHQSIEKLNNDYYELFPIGEFELSILINQPLIKVLPEITLKNRRDLFTIKFIDNYGDEVFSFEYLGKKSAVIIEGKDSLFDLEISKNIIFDKSLQEVQINILNKEIIINNDISFWRFLLKPNLSVEEIIYDLFILKQRELRGFEYSDKVYDKKIHIKDISDGKEKVEEKWVYLEKGHLYEFKVSFSKWKTFSTKIRSALLQNLKVKTFPSSKKTEIYNQFRKIPFKERHLPNNIFKLMSAWTLDFSDELFMKEIIRTLERSKVYESPLLVSLYTYSRKKFGETFTTRDNFLRVKETSSQRLKRLKELEDQSGQLNDKRFKEDINIRSGEEIVNENIEESKGSELINK